MSSSVLDQRPKTLEEENMMRQVPYASAMGSLMHAKSSKMC